MDPRQVPGPALLSGLPHPEPLREGALHRPAGVRSAVCGAPGGGHRDGHRAALGGR